MFIFISMPNATHFLQYPINYHHQTENIISTLSAVTMLFYYIQQKSGILEKYVYHQILTSAHNHAGTLKVQD